MLEALLFDMDGVILDNNAYHKLSWLEYSKLLGQPLDDDSFGAKVYGKTNEEILEALLGPVLTKDEVQHHAEAKEALYRKMYEPHFELAAGLESFMQNVAESGLKIAVATNAPQSNLDFALEKGDLGRWVSAAVHSHLVAKPKPAPDIYLKAMELLGVEAANCVVFEDSLTGARAGKAAGAKVIGITTTYTRAELEPIVDYVIDSFTELSLQEVRDLVG
jgi:HAD superfamily hydrolase (TIGR01509 family)